MLDVNQVLAALAAKLPDLQQAEAETEQVRDLLNTGVATVVELGRAGVNRRLAAVASPGARPTHDLDICADIVVPFAHRWHNHQQARAWAAATLRHTPTFAVDGSQILPGKEVSLPVSLVQVGWFENRHNGQGDYTKALQVDVLTAADLMPRGQSRRAAANEISNWRRFQAEIERIITYMEEQAGAEPAPLCFFDGSLILSFVQQLFPAEQQRYLQLMRRLLATSAATAVPVVGFVDTSYARDVVTMLANLQQLPLTPVLSDAALFQPRLQWGDRTQVFICARDDAIAASYYETVYFTYLLTAAAAPPVRIEFPRWLYDSGRHEAVLDLIRAECIVGVGYPYVVETADAVAVLTREDRDHFYRLLQQFAAAQSLPLYFSRKAVSKRRRRR